MGSDELYMYCQFVNYLLDVARQLKVEEHCQHFTEEIAIDFLRILRTRAKKTLKQGYMRWNKKQEAM